MLQFVQDMQKSYNSNPPNPLNFEQGNFDLSLTVIDYNFRIASKTL